MRKKKCSESNFEHVFSMSKRANQECRGRGAEFAGGEWAPSGGPEKLLGSNLIQDCTIGWMHQLGQSDRTGHSDEVDQSERTELATEMDWSNQTDLTWQIPCATRQVSSRTCTSRPQLMLAETCIHLTEATCVKKYSACKYASMHVNTLNMQECRKGILEITITEGHIPK